MSEDQIRLRVSEIRVRLPDAIPMAGDQIRLKAREIRVRLPEHNPNGRRSNKVKGS